MTTVLAFAVPAQVVFAGVLTGLTYGLAAVAVVLVYRSSRVINLATAELGGFAAAVLAFLVINHRMNYWLALVLCVALGGALGVLIELVVVRRLASAPRIMLLVATIGLAQLLLFGQAVLPEPTAVRPYPTPFHGSWKVAGLFVRSEHIVILAVMPVVSLALAWFLARTRSGLAIRAAAANAAAARLAGISTRRTSTLVWGLAGAFTALATILSAPFTTTISSEVFTLGPGLLVRVLAAALIGRMVSLTWSLLGGVLIGVVESVIFYNNPANRGLTDLLVFAVVLVVLLALSRREREQTSEWSFAPRSRTVSRRAGQHWLVRRSPQIATVAVVVGGLIPLLAAQTASQAFAWSQVAIYALAALSLTVLTGWAGQLSIGQFAFVGLGAMTATALVRSDVGPGPALVAAAAVGAAAAILVGAPARRLPGLFLAVSTLALGVASSSWLLSRHVFLHGDPNATLPRLIIGPVSLVSQRTYYAVCLGALLLAVWAVRRLRQSALGRAFVAVRSNEPAAASFGVSPTRTKLTAFGISGALAGVSGALLAGLVVTVAPGRFSGTESLRLVSIVVIGGLASVAGTVLGAVWVVGIPALFPGRVSVPLFTSGVGLLVLVMFVPGGLAELVARIRDLVVRVLDRSPVEPATAGTGTGGVEVGAGDRADAESVEPAPITLRTIELGGSGPSGGAARPGPVLAVRSLSVRRGERSVVADVDLVVGPGEVVGLIGANGAGKSTIMDAIGGFLPCTGTVELGGLDVAGRSPSQRARLGLGRTYQGATLFADLTVRETVQVAAEHRRADGDGRRRAPNARAASAATDDLVDGFGLGPLADRFVDELSTGSRRILELACLVARGSRMLCLDEATAGISQREVEALAPFLLRLRDELGASLLVIEHDMPFISGLCDRMYCLDAGQVIAEGTSEEVRHDPAVVAAYLGTEDAAINRSGPATPVP